MFGTAVLYLNLTTFERLLHSACKSTLRERSVKRAGQTYLKESQNDCRKLSNVLHNLNSSFNIVRMIKSKKLR
jgi:hypothetical protein